MTLKERNAQKLQAFNEAIEAHGQCLITCNPVYPTSMVPPQYGKQYQLGLLFGYNIPIPTDDLRTDEEGVSATLSFDHRPHRVFIPWTAVYALSLPDGSARGWPQDIPAELLTTPERQAAKTGPQFKTAGEKPKTLSGVRKILPSFLKILPGGKSN